MPTAQELFGGFWGGAYASPVIDAYAEALTAYAAEYRPTPLELLASDRVSPGPDGRPTFGYPLSGDAPAWIALDLVGGPVLCNDVDYTVSDEYVWFETDPLIVSTNSYFTYVDGAQVLTATVWMPRVEVPDPTPTPEPATLAAVSRAIATACDSPGTGDVPETVEAVWTATDGTHRVVTDLNAYRLTNPDNLPEVEVGDVLPPGTSIGTAWTLTKLGPAAPTLEYLTTPAPFHQGVTDGGITWYNADSPLVVDVVDDHTRARFSVGGDSLDVEALWAQSQDTGVAAGRTLAQALDTRANPVGEPGPESLPTVVNPLDLLCRQLLGGCAYLLVVRPDQFGSDATSTTARQTAVTKAAGPYVHVFEYENEVPALTLVNPA